MKRFFHHQMVADTHEWEYINKTTYKSTYYSLHLN